MQAAVLLMLSVAVCSGAIARAPQLVHKTNPAYTREARDAAIEGTVVLYAEIGTDGRAHNMQVIQGLGYGLDARAMECVRHWRFRPATEDGVPVSKAAVIEVNFRLKDGAARPVWV
jgi:protein TonB